MVTYVKISPKMVNPRDIAGNAEEEEAREVCVFSCVASVSECLSVCSLITKLSHEGRTGDIYTVG